MPIRFEACVEGVDGVRAAAAGGAHRAELCASLVTGGLSPSPGVVAEARRVPGIGLMAMVRPREGDFCYTDGEVASMRADVVAFRKAGVDGVVFGLLHPDGTVDAERTAELIALARPMSVTFHRAFDRTPDPLAALDTLIALGVDRVLTSGLAPTAHEGAPLLRRLVQRAAGRVVILPAVGIRPDNVAALVAATGVGEVHATAFAKTESPMTYRNPEVYMGAPGLEEYVRDVTDVGAVHAMVNALRLIGG